MTRRNGTLLAFLFASMLSLSVHSETVETIRVLERQNSYQLVETSCVKGMQTTTSGPWYEVSYSYQGRIVREIVGYNPGRYVALMPNGKPQTLPYDNPK